MFGLKRVMCGWYVGAWWGRTSSGMSVLYGRYESTLHLQPDAMTSCVHGRSSFVMWQQGQRLLAWARDEL